MLWVLWRLELKEFSYHFFGDCDFIAVSLNAPLPLPTLSFLSIDTSEALGGKGSASVAKSCLMLSLLFKQGQLSGTVGDKQTHGFKIVI
jgi:hypothetical protein